MEDAVRYTCMPHRQTHNIIITYIVYSPILRGQCQLLSILYRKKFVVKSSTRIFIIIYKTGTEYKTIRFFLIFLFFFITVCV